jgi:FtsP/CotA-like multicopper oxidase with cupredoxin domain
VRASSKLSRRRFLAGTVPVLAGLPLLRAAAASAEEHPGADHVGAAGSPPDHATVMERLASGGKSGETATDALLYPPPAEPARHGRVRELELVAESREVEIAPGVRFPAWTYNGSVPGPVIRATEGDRLRVRFRNEGGHPHTIHFHGTHAPGMDGSGKPVAPGQSFTYEIPAKPAGLHLYHCHVSPFAEHLNRGLYGAFIVDPPDPRPPAQELVLVLSAFDTDGDERNDVYAMNGRAFSYHERPIVVRRGKPVRIYLVNATEYDDLSSFHLHAAMFRLFRTGTAREPEVTDTVMLCQGERAILEVEFEEKGLYMFHPHQSRALKGGAMGWFQVVDTDAEAAGAAVALNGYADELADCNPCIDELGAKALLKY